MPCCDTTKTAPTEFEFNLSSLLYRASTIIDERARNGWLLYAPDFAGLPVVVDEKAARR
jgi:hypothetical protein